MWSHLYCINTYQLLLRCHCSDDEHCFRMSWLIYALQGQTKADAICSFSKGNVLFSSAVSLDNPTFTYTGTTPPASTVPLRMMGSLPSRLSDSRTTYKGWENVSLLGSAVLSS